MAQQPKKAGKPNILVIWGDDIGIANLSCYTRGLMGYRTPNIDRIAGEGMIFTDSYGEQSCTAGRAGGLAGRSWASRPPSTGSVAPVMYVASSEIRKATAAATSCGVPTRASGTIAPRFGAGVRPRASMSPGATALTRMPWGARSTASALVIASIPPLAAS